MHGNNITKLLVLVRTWREVVTMSDMEDEAWRAMP